MKKEYLGRNKVIQLFIVGFIFVILELILTGLFDSIFLRKTALSHLAFLFIIPGLFICLVCFFNRIKSFVMRVNFKKKSFFIGNYSLEIYLILMSMGKFLIVISKISTLILAFFLKHFVFSLMGKRLFFV